MKVSAETKKKVREFVFSEFGKDRVRSVDLEIGFNVYGEESFVLTMIVEPGETFEDKGSEIFNLSRNIRRIGGKEFSRLAPVFEVSGAKD